jgi:hypothetical protein
MQSNDIIDVDLLQLQINMCVICISGMKPFLKPLVTHSSDQAHLMYGLLLSPKYKELREVSCLWEVMFPDMPKDERGQQLVKLVEEYEKGLVQLMTNAIEHHASTVIDLCASPSASAPQSVAPASAGSPVRRAGPRVEREEQSKDAAQREYARWVQQPLSEVRA